MSTYSACTNDRFSRWIDLRHALMAEDAENFVWRGVANADWCMEPSIERFARASGKADRNSLTHKLLRLYDDFLTETDVMHDEAEERLWGLGQHYGLPTPFLDWSRSPMAAAYFALSSDDPLVPRATRNACVWRLDISKAFLQHGDLQLVEIGPGVWNRRLRAQQGVFTKANATGCAIDTLLKTAGHISALKAYVFPANIDIEGLKELSAMMIDDLRMFPDHEGVIRHVRTLAAH